MFESGRMKLMPCVGGEGPALQVLVGVKFPGRPGCRETLVSGTIS